MKILVVSEFDVIKSTCRRALRALHGVENVNVVHPRTLNYYFDVYKKFGGTLPPELILFDVDSIGTFNAGTYWRFQSMYNIIQALPESSQPTVGFMASRCNFELFNNGEKNNNREKVLAKPFNINELMIFCRNLITLQCYKDGRRKFSGNCSNQTKLVSEW